MKKTPKIEMLYWLIPIILIINVFVVYYGRVHSPNNWNDCHGQVSFIENYLSLCVFEFGCLLIPLLLIGAFLFIGIMIIPSWNRQFNLDLFKSWNPDGYQRIKDAEEAKEQGVSLSQFYRENTHPFLLDKKENNSSYKKPFQNKFEYTPKQRIAVTQQIFIETFDDDRNMGLAIQFDSTLIGKSKEDIINILNSNKNLDGYSIGEYYKLKGIETIRPIKDEIIKIIVGLKDFKWIIINRVSIELNEEDLLDFEYYKRRGFPNYNIN